MLEEKILLDYKEAMKNRDALRSSVLNFLRAEMINLAIAKKKKNLEDSDCIAVIRKQIKQRQDSIEQFKQGNRQDLAEKEARELEILKPYLPQELSSEELESLVDQAIALSGAQGLKEMGKVMKEVNLKVAGRADGKLVSDTVRRKLSPEIA
ncbi:GatB/YqeY domain-containing protein [bacterium]|nr:MAG: GatB/YqeY domain-containing protein [bacterium]